MNTKRTYTDKEVFSWLYQNAKGQILACVLLVFANIGLACMGVAFALASKSVIDAMPRPPFRAGWRWALNAVFCRLF